MTEPAKYVRTSDATPATPEEQAAAARRSASQDGWSVGPPAEGDGSDRPRLAEALDALGPDDVLITDDDGGGHD